MQLGVSLEPPRPSGDRELILQTARTAERLGFRYVLMSSHVLANASGSAMDPLVLLSAVSSATSRIGLATSVLVLPYYHPVVLANQTASLDVLSNGRFVLGVGTGWNPEEFAAIGVPLGERGARTDEYLAVMKALWSRAPADYEGRFTSFRQASIGVSPRTAGGPPIWVGGHSDAALRRALRFADGWHGAGIDHVAMAGIRDRLTVLGDEVSRDPATLRLTSVCFLTPPGLEQIGPAPGRLLGGPKPTAGKVLEDLSLLGEAGISMCSLWMPVAAPRMVDALEWVAEEIMPKLDATSTRPGTLGRGCGADGWLARERQGVLRLERHEPGELARRIDTVSRSAPSVHAPLPTTAKWSSSISFSRSDRARLRPGVLPPLPSAHGNLR